MTAIAIAATRRSNALLYKGLFPSVAVSHAQLLSDGKQPSYAFIKVFNCKFRSECLNAHWFMCIEDARAKMKDCCSYFHEERSNSGIGQNIQFKLRNFDSASGPSLAKEAENSNLK